MSNKSTEKVVSMLLNGIRPLQRARHTDALSLALTPKRLVAGDPDGMVGGDAFIDHTTPKRSVEVRVRTPRCLKVEPMGCEPDLLAASSMRFASASATLMDNR
jgi:hypothetical protein